MAKKPRKTVVILEAVEPIVVTKAMAARGEALVVPIEARLETSYDRPQKPEQPKIVHQIPLRGSRSSAQHPLRALMEFEFLLACDTSTRDLDGSPVSVGSVFEAERRVNGEELVVTIRGLAAFEFRGITSEPEKVSWAHLLRKLERRPPASLGLVVDAHQGELMNFNARRDPVLDDYLLPAWATLIYASADTGTEHLANQLLLRCDREAARIQGIIADRKVGSEGLHAVEHPRYTHIREWWVGRGRRAGYYWIKR